MKKLIAGFMTALMALLIVATPVSAVTVKEFCPNSTYEIETYEYTITTNDTTEIVNSTQEIECLNGCSNTLGKCRPNAYELHVSSFALIIFIIAVGILGIRYAGYYTPVVLMLILTLTLAVYSTDVFIGSDKLLILIVSIALIAMNMDEFLNYRGWKKYKSDDE